MSSTLRRVIPKPVKRALRRVLEPAFAAARRRSLRRQVAALRRDAAVGRVPMERIAALAAAWGNDGFAADAAFLTEVAERARRGPGPFLDCGSGLTTIVAGTVADVCGGRVCSLEQNAAWYDDMHGLLRALAIESVDLWHTPLRAYDDAFAWFDLRGRTLPSAFSHVFCDGPLIARKQWPLPIFAAWRVGVVPVLQSLGARFDEILLDDAEDARSAGVRTRWESLGLTTRVVETPTGAWIHGLVRLTAGSAADAAADFSQ